MAGFEKLESLVISDEEKEQKAKMVNRNVVTLTALARIIHAISDCYRNAVTRDLETYVEFVKHLLGRGRASLPRLGQQGLVDKLKRDVYAPAFLHHVTSRHIRVPTLLTTLSVRQCIVPVMLN